jgi:hypothetical protein
MLTSGPDEPTKIGLFELWMGNTPEEWDGLSEAPSADDAPAQPDQN